MNNSETRTYIERQLVKLGWKVQLDKASYKKIFQFTGGEEERVGQLFYKLVSVGSLHPGRVIVDSTVNAAINDLKRMENIVDKAKAEGKAGPKSRTELDRFSIDQLAKTLETEVALEEKEARLAEEKFPTVETTQAPKKDASPSSLPRILVVDDSPTIRAAVTKALKNDFEFAQAPDGEEAWKILKSDDSIQLVITDLMMPKLDGYELIKRIRSDRSSPRIAEMPIIVVTTLEAANAKLRALVAGANDFVTKSTDAVELKMRVMARYEVAQSVKAFAEGRATAKAAADTAAQPRAAQTQAPASQGAAAATPPRAAQAPASQGAAAATPPRAAQAPASQNAAATPPRAAQTSQSATPQKGPSTNTMAGNAASAASARTSDSRTSNLEVRRPISPAAITAPVTTILKQTVGSGKLGEVIDKGKSIIDRLAKLNPLTAITFGATGLIILIVVGIALVNRPQRGAPQLTATAPEAETLASATAGTDKQPDTASQPAPKTTESTKSVVNTQSTTGTAPKAREQTQTRKSDTEPAKVAAANNRTSGQIEAGKEQATGQVPAASTPVKTEGVQAASSVPVAVAAVATAQSVSPGPTAAPSTTTAAAATPVAPVSNVISQADLVGVIKRFEFVYEAGDIEQFLRLFDNNVRTNDRYSKDGLREDYEGLFKTTDMRNMVLGNMTWEARDNHADGWGNFEVRVRKVGEQEIKTYKGSLTFYVEKIDGRVRIKRLYHGQWRAS